MMTTAQQYFDESRLMDIRLVSTVGFDEEDIGEIAGVDGVEAVMPGYTADLITRSGDTDSVVRLYSVPEAGSSSPYVINQPVLVDGRLPTSTGECAIESYYLDMTGYHIGDTITFRDEVDGKSTLDYVNSLSYQIVGVVYSPLYLTYQRGNTTIGDGTIAFYMMIPPEEFAYERYTAVYVRTRASDDGTDSFSDTYKEAADDYAQSIKAISQTCIDRFNATTLADAQRELSNAQKEYAEKKEEALEQITDGEKQLYEGLREYNDKIAEAEQTLADSEQKIEDGKAQLAQAQQDYLTGVEDAQKKLEEARTQYNDGLAQYNDAKTEYDNQIAAAETQLSAARAEYNTQYTVFYSSTKPQAETTLSLMRTALDAVQAAIDSFNERIAALEQNGISDPAVQAELDSLKASLREAQAKADEYEKQYQESMQQLADGEQQLLDAKKQLDDAEKELSERKAEGAVQLNEAKKKLDDAETQLHNGELEYQTALTTGMVQLQNAQSELAEGEARLKEGREELQTQRAEGMHQLKEAREQLAEGKYQAHTQLSEAEEKLTDAAEALDALNEAKWYVYTREDNPGYSGLKEDAYRVDNVAKVFPLFFLIVAALVCLTTMSRMVEERRTETGTLKALGYSNWAISAKYVLYGVSASAAGCLIGGAAGLTTLPQIIVDTYGIMYTLPPTVTAISWDSYLAASGAGILCILLVALFACSQDLKINPAELMRPKAPKPGKRILLEHITPVWKRMSFTSKVTARNLFRYKARFLMTVIGVAGCTALIVAALGLRNSINVVGDRQYGELNLYDQVYALSESGTSAEKAPLSAQFHADSRFDSVLLCSYQSASIANANGKNKNSSRVVIGENPDDFSDIFVLRNRITKEAVSLTDDGVVIDERMSEVLSVRAGDNVIIYVDDEPYTVTVTGITENYSGNFIYMTPQFYQKLTGKEAQYEVIFTSLTESAQSSSSAIANEYMKKDDIITVTLIADTVAAILDMVSSLDVVVLVMIFCAGLLAVVVLYNLTNINIAERVREIATIKVLGFYNLETANYIYRENIVLTVTGAATGLVLGDMFMTFIIESIQMNNVMFPKGVAPLSYILAFALTLAFAMLVNFIMYFKMNKISMVESLKSIE